MTSFSRILRAVVNKALQDEEVVRKAHEHTQEFCASADQDKRGFEGLPPEPGSWGIKAEIVFEHGVIWLAVIVNTSMIIGIPILAVMR